MNGIVAYGSYLPYFRLDRKAIGDALAGGGGKGSRTVASYDEDTTSMGVEAARAALRGAPRLAPAAIYFATADPAYLDKTNPALFTVTNADTCERLHFWVPFSAERAQEWSDRAAFIVEASSPGFSVADVSVKKKMRGPNTGELAIEDRPDGQGCRFVVRLRPARRSAA